MVDNQLRSKNSEIINRGKGSKEEERVPIGGI